MQKKWIFLTGILVCLLVGGWAFYNYHKPRSVSGNEKAAYTLDAATLYRAFNTDEASANERYNGKILSVKGVVDQVIKNEKAVIIVLEAGDELGGVSCSFSTVEKTYEWPEVGALVTINGRCSGFLMDVNLVDAVLL